MDRMIQAIARARNESARREVLHEYAGECSFLTDPPLFPQLPPPLDFAMPRGTREFFSKDYLLGTLGLSFAGRRKRRLVRFVYSGRFGILQTGFIQVIDLVWDMEFALTEEGKDYADWDELSPRFLPDSMLASVCDQVLEHEAAKMAH